ncbi:uncharacterized protein A4U43_C07F13200 [Asparagus officinalis]|uniref:Uncharacterized protein n=1 Tax=Asparagus officinalis TaxID=4686 RepID=A0A5P1EBN0_ASPOF|nr:uncharacterized protein A4U43_C07F13200 [Asparagus officinalis]
MDSLRFVRGLPPMPISASGAAGRHQSPAAQVSVAGPRAEAEEVEGRRKRGNWVLNILRVGSTWEKGREKKVAVDAGEDLVEGLGADSRCLDCDECVVDDEEREVFDRDSFSRLLRRVSIVEMEIYAKMSYLGRLAYSIPKIKPASLLKYHGLRFITSSLEKRAKSSNAEEKTPDPNKPEEKLPNNVTSSESSTVAEDNEKQNKKTPIINHVAKILKAVNGNFRNHPCLQHQKLLYAPMGKLLILQPEEKFSPNHHLLPPGSGLYLLGHPLSNSDDSMKHLLSAQLAFLNSPHPLEILSDRSAYGSEGTIYRDHDMDAYLRSVRSVIRRELKLIRKAKRQSRRILWWPLVSTQGSDAIIGQRARLTNSNQHHFNFVGVFNGGKDTLKRFGRIIASRNVQLFIVFLAPARLLVMGTLSLFPH